MLFNWGRTREGKERERVEATGCISARNNNRFITNLDRHNFADDLRIKKTPDPRLHAGRYSVAFRGVFLVGLCLRLLYGKSEGKVKGKAVPLEAWSAPEGSRKLRYTDYKRTAQDGGKIVSLTYRPHSPPGNAPGTHFCYRLCWPQGHSAIRRILCQWKIPMSPAGIEPATFWFVTQRLNHCATAVPSSTCIYGKGKGKVIPLQAWSGPEGSRKLRLPDFMTMAQDGGKVVSPTNRPPLLPGNTLALIPVRGWVDSRAIVWSEGFYVNEKKAGIEPATFRLVAQHLNHCATAVPRAVQQEAWYSRFSCSTKLKFCYVRRHGLMTHTV